MSIHHFVALVFLCAPLARAYQLPVKARPVEAPESPVEFRIEAARKQLKAEPRSVGAVNNLAFALIRKGRDTRDEADYVEAAKAIDQSLILSPGNYDAQKLRIADLLGLNEPAAALKVGAELNHKVPDDIAVWALLADANAAVGNYDQAEKDAQWVLDLRQGNALGFEKAAALRELYGDSEGAMEFLDEAGRRTSSNDGDQKAWLLTQKAQLELGTGNTKAAGELVMQALDLFPDSQSAQAVLAQVRMAEGNYAASLSILEERYRRVPSAANQYDVAEALAAAGRTEEAARQFGNFEQQARAGLAKHRTAVLQLIGYYSDRKLDPTEALTLASAEAARRQDTATLAAYAWALYKNGKFAEAKVQMDTALAVGVHNAVYFCHATAIYGMVKDEASATRYAKELLAMPGATCPAGNKLQSANEVTR